MAPDADRSVDEAFSKWPLVGREHELADLRRRMRDGCGVVLVGPAGVGKSRLAAEARSFAEVHGYRVFQLRASAAMAQSPLAAIPPLTGHDERPAGTADLIHQVMTGLDLGAGERPICVSVDDAHELDETSSVVLTNMAVGGDVLLILGATSDRNGPPAAPALTRLWTDGGCDRLEVGPLTKAEVDTLLSAVLAGPIDQATRHHAWRLSEGNPLHLRQLVLSMLETQDLTFAEGEWRWRDPDLSSRRLVDLIERRLAHLSRSERDLLDLVALADGEGLGLFARFDPEDDLESLERRGLIEVGLDGRRQPVRTASPLLGEVIRSSMTKTRTSRALTQLATAVTELGERRRGDVLTLARWHLRGAIPVSVDQLCDAAELAYNSHDDRAAEQIARVAQATGGGARAAWLLGASLQELGRTEEAEQVLAAIQLDEVDEVVAVRAAIRRADNLFWALGRDDDARAVLSRAMSACKSFENHEVLLGTVAAFDLMAGRPLDVLASTDPTGRHLRRPSSAPEDAASDDTSGRPLVGTNAAVAAAPALVLVGRGDEAIRWIDEVLASPAETGSGDDRSIAEIGMFVVARCHALTELGSLDEAAELAAFGYEQSLEMGSTVGLAWFALKRARAAIFAGRVTTAHRWFAEGAIRYGELHQTGCRRWCVAGQLWSAALRGDRERSGELAQQLDEIAAGAVVMMEPEVNRARAAHAQLEGRIGDAEKHLVEAVELARDHEMIVLEAGALLDLCRLGRRVRESRTRLDGLSSVADGRLVATEADFAGAIAQSTLPDLERASDTLAAIGANLLAADAASRAAEESEADRDRTRLRRRAFALLERCEGATLPHLSAASASADLAALTRREREIATLAVRGRSTRELAEELNISYRTVENHLHRIYTKLGVSGRDELTDALDSS